ncbi:MAG: DUF5132 domain-containing protein [Desulfobacterales bacterium]
MGLLDNGFKMGGSVVAGAAVVLLAPVVVPVVASILKPVTKAIIKGGLMTYGKMKEQVAETMETFDDLAAEAKAELAQPEEKPQKPKKVAAAAK